DPDDLRAEAELHPTGQTPFVHGAEVVRIVEKDGAAAGVELADGTVAPADRVVAGVAPGRLVARALDRDGDVGPRGTDRSGSGAGQVPGRFTVLLSLRGARDPDAAHRTVVHSPDGSAEAADVFAGRTAALPTVTVTRPDDPATRPDEGHEAVTLTATVAAHTPLDWSDPALRERYADVLAERAGAALPGLAQRLIRREVRTPADTEAQTGAAGGSVPPPALAGGSGGFLYPANSTRLTGLYRAGGWAHPGGGLAHAGMSGALVAGLIVEGAEFRGSR
ncbi:phytoene desaturase family protein, partial [Streptomyces corynorhini]